MTTTDFLQFNDGMGGGDLLEWNLIFNMVRLLNVIDLQELLKPSASSPYASYRYEKLKITARCKINCAFHVVCVCRDKHAPVIPGIGNHSTIPTKQLAKIHTALVIAV